MTNDELRSLKSEVGNVIARPAKLAVAISLFGLLLIYAAPAQAALVATWIS